MPYFVYILYSKTADKYYVGHTSNVDDRLFRHTNSGSKSTKHTDDWILKYRKTYDTRSEAMRKELEIKRKKSRKYIEWLISS